MSNNANVTEIVEEVRNLSRFLSFLTLAEAEEIVKEYNSKGQYKMKVEGNPDGSLTLTEERTGINLSIVQAEITG